MRAGPVSFSSLRVQLSKKKKLFCDVISSVYWINARRGTGFFVRFSEIGFGFLAIGSCNSEVDTIKDLSLDKAKGNVADPRFRKEGRKRHDPVPDTTEYRERNRRLFIHKGHHTLVRFMPKGKEGLS